MNVPLRPTPALQRCRWQCHVTAETDLFRLSTYRCDLPAVANYWASVWRLVLTHFLQEGEYCGGMRGRAVVGPGSEMELPDCTHLAILWVDVDGMKVKVNGKVLVHMYEPLTFSMVKQRIL